MAVENKIKSTTTGDAQAEQLKKLHEMYQSALDEITEGYSGIVGSFLEENGVSGEKEKIYSSIINGAESKIEEYRKALSENAALEGLKETQDQWLLEMMRMWLQSYGRARELPQPHRPMPQMPRTP